MSLDDGNQITKTLLFAAQNNDLATVEYYLSLDSSLLNLKDDYGWSILMIASQSNSYEVVKFLISHGADISIQDKAGNNAYKLAKKFHNYNIMKLLKERKILIKKDQGSELEKAENTEEKFFCQYCEEECENKYKHISTTLHNINVSNQTPKHIWYGIPESNKGFQMLLKSGWKKGIGLGKTESGNKYPIKPIVNQRRSGLGVKKNKTNDIKLVKTNSLHEEKQTRLKHTHMERNFRRQFY